MHVAYIINQYPKVSHSFVRREIQALEQAGYRVSRYAVRASTDTELVDKRDKEELSRTQVIVGTSLLKLVAAMLQTLVRYPWRALRAFIVAIRFGFNSDRGIIRHLAYWGEALVFTSWARRDQITHLHAHFGTNSAFVAMLVGLLEAVPFSFTVHGPEEFDKADLIGLTEKMQKAAFVVAISSFGRSQLMRRLSSADWDKIHIVRCGLDHDFMRRDPVPINDTPNLVCVGRLCEQKAQILTVKAVARLVTEGMPVRLTLAGDGEMRADIEDFIKQEKLEGHVMITGWVSSDEVRTLINQSRALILPSFAEGLPVVLMEALALGRPVVSSYVAGIPELVKDGENGWLVPAGDVGALLTCLRSVLNKPTSTLEEMGRVGRKTVLERHNIDIEAKKLISLIAQAAKGEDQSAEAVTGDPKKIRIEGAQ